MTEHQVGPDHYPTHREADVVLRDGSTVHIRPVRRNDLAAMKAFLEGLSTRSRYFRFFAMVHQVDRLAESAVDVDYRTRYSLAATYGPEATIVGHAIYFQTGRSRAEAAFAVADAFQGYGLGTILLAHLAQAAVEHHIGLFEARVLAENHRMVEVFRESGFPVQMRSGMGEIEVEFPTELTAGALERFDRREQSAAVAAVTAILKPGSIAVVGASRERGSIGGEVFHNLIATGFNGPVHPVNRDAAVVQSVSAYPSILDIPQPVDLAVVVVPAAHVVDVATECGRKGVKAIVVISSGFAEVGEIGRERQRGLVEVCRQFGMRLVGPNCMGVMNSDPEVSMNATFAPAFPPHGRVAFSSQSGALGLAVIDYATTLGLGLSSFVSVGNKADISGNDLIHYWADDPATDVILLYLESFGNPRKFARITRRVGRTKPIIAVKSGRSTAGVRATSSHTGALIAASDVTVDALFRQAGVVRTDTLAELFDVAALLANQPPPAGGRVGIVTNAGGLGILCADACEGHGLDVPPLSEALRRRLSEFLPPEASVSNPVDMIASASSEDYARVIELLGAGGGVDSIIVLFVPPLVTRPEDVARAIRSAAAGLPPGIPLLTVFMSAQGVPEELRGEGLRIPSYRFPEDAAGALARAVEYGTWRGQPEGVEARFEGLQADEAAGVIATALADGPRWLEPDEVARLFDCYGLPLAEWRLTDTAPEAGEAAAELTGEVALKAVGPTIVHKTEAGGVRLGLQGAAAVSAAAEHMARSIQAQGQRVERFLVQRMVPQGIEVLVGVVHDPQFGPVIACGAGGVFAEVLKDVAVRITPLTDTDAADIVRALRIYPLLEGFRGAPRHDIEALEELLLRVSVLVEAHPEVAEMDCNPVMALPDRVVIVDARVRVEQAEPSRPLAARTV